MSDEPQLHEEVFNWKGVLRTALVGFVTTSVLGIGLGILVALFFVWMAGMIGSSTTLSQLREWIGGAFWIVFLRVGIPTLVHSLLVSWLLHRPGGTRLPFCLLVSCIPGLALFFVSFPLINRLDNGGEIHPEAWGVVGAVCLVASVLTAFAMRADVIAQLKKARSNAP